MARPEPGCCRPWRLGDTWRHQAKCPEYPNQHVGYERAHPAGSALTRAEEKWQKSPKIGPMDYWASYFDWHVDEDADA